MQGTDCPLLEGIHIMILDSRFQGLDPHNPRLGMDGYNFQSSSRPPFP